MKLHEIVKIQKRSKKRVGRGIGSGKGKSAGRGTKGQKARGKIPLGFSGDLAFYKKLPKLRGLGNPKVSPNPKVVTLSTLNTFPAKAIIDLEQLLRANIIKKREVKRGVKILNIGEIKKALTVKLAVSKAAGEKIKRRGGKV